MGVAQTKTVDVLWTVSEFCWLCEREASYSLTTLVCVATVVWIMVELVNSVETMVVSPEIVTKSVLWMRQHLEEQITNPNPAALLQNGQPK